jgi:hypothetical protein
MPLATYHHADGSTVDLEVSQKHEDGTVDLSLNDVVVVHRCPVADAPRAGHCLVSPVRAEKKKKSEEKQARLTKLRDEALRLDNIAAELEEKRLAASKAFDKLRGRPGHEEAEKALADATAAASAADQAADEAAEALKAAEAE